MRTLVIWVTCVVAGVVPLVATAEEAAPLRSLVEAEDQMLERLERSIPELLRESDVPGLQMAVVTPAGLRWSTAHGLLESGDADARVTNRTAFEAASLSKPVVAYVVLRLADRGVLDLDLPLAQTVPEPRVADQSLAWLVRPTTVLHHATGLPNWGGDRLESAFTPDDGFGYSGEGYVWLQKVVESVTGEPFEDVASREVFEPLGMSRSSFVWAGATNEAAVGHFRGGGSRPINQPQANAAGSLVTTAEEYARFLHAVWTGRGLSKTSHQLLTGRSNPVRDRSGTSVEGLGWTLGWGWAGPVDADHGPTLWHWGDNGAFRAFVALDERTGVGAVYLANSENGLQLIERLVEPIVGDLRSAIDWIAEPQLDDPDQVALRRLRLAFGRANVEVAEKLLESMYAGSPDLVDGGLIARLAEEFLQGGQPTIASAVVQSGLGLVPDDPRLWIASARIALDGERWAEAVAALERATHLAPGNDQVERGLSWARDLARVAREPVEVDAAVLESLAGAYGPRVLRVERGRLVYQREGREPFPLVPLGENVFALRGESEFRIRVETDEAGRGQRVVGLYVNGNEDASERSD